jgi:predicted enzyme related to lactoylglutathione lyase
MRVRGYPPGAPCWADVTSPDPMALCTFYRELLGWKAEEYADGYVTFQLDGRTVAGLRPLANGQPGGWLPYIATDDLDAALATASAAGGTRLAAPREVAGAARSALMVDPAGAVFGLWQHGVLGGAQVVNEPGSMYWTELATREPDGALEFYASVFGWRYEATGGSGGDEGGYVEWYAHDRTLAGMVTIGDDAPAYLRSQWTVTFLVADCAATAYRAGQIGGKILAAPTDVGVGISAQLADPHRAGFRVIELTPEIFEHL